MNIELESVRIEVALQAIALGTSCALAIGGAAATQGPWSVWLLRVAAGYCATVTAIFFVIQERYQRQVARYRARYDEYVQQCS